MILSVISSLLIGCEFRRIAINDPIRSEDVAFIVPGTTTLSEIVGRLGVPDEMTGSKERTVLHYRFLVAKIFRIDFGYLLYFWSPVTPDMILSRGDLGTDVFKVSFDSNWVVQWYAFANESEASRFTFWPF